MDLCKSPFFFPFYIVTLSVKRIQTLLVHKNLPLKPTCKKQRFRNVYSNFVTEFSSKFLGIDSIAHLGL